ncbi:MAG: hypothetical protein WC476_12640 [Phycisphaerae bacterium]|jgi:uncharacterized membrane protein YhdT
MKTILTYLIVWLIVITGLSFIGSVVEIPLWYSSKILFINCSLIGAAGGILYCLRGIYLNKCVIKQWADTWNIWYYLRPLTSGITGFVSCVFLKAGLIILEAEQKPDSVMYGYLALAFIAGYNVDNFLKKLESIAQEVWGIKKSRVADNEKDK